MFLFNVGVCIAIFYLYTIIYYKDFNTTLVTYRDDESSRSLIERRSDESISEVCRRRLFVICGWILLILGMILLTLGVRQLYRMSRGCAPANTSEYQVWPSRGVNLTKVSFPLNLTDFFMKSSKLCETVSVNDGDSLNRIYVVKDDRNLTECQACGLESILRLFPDRTVYLIDFNRNNSQKYDRCSVPHDYLGLLKVLYNDRLHVLPADKSAFFKDTPLQNVTKTEENFPFLAMVLTAYKYGGFVTTPSVVMTNRELIECFPEETIVEPFVIISTKRCHEYLHYLMESFGLCDHRINASLDEILTQTSDLFSKDQSSKNDVARRLTPGEVNSDPDNPSTFLRMKGCRAGDTKWVSDLASYCKQVVQAHLGMTINRMEVEAETSEMRSLIMRSRENLMCSPRQRPGKPESRGDCFLEDQEN